MGKRNELGTLCVQAVRVSPQKAVDEPTHLPQPPTINSHQPRLIHILTHHTTELSEHLSKLSYTGFFNQKTERDRMLYTLSTEPITTTTTYI